MQKRASPFLSSLASETRCGPQACSPAAETIARAMSSNDPTAHTRRSRFRGLWRSFSDFAPPRHSINFPYSLFDPLAMCDQSAETFRGCFLATEPRNYLREIEVCLNVW